MHLFIIIEASYLAIFTYGPFEGVDTRKPLLNVLIFLGILFITFYYTHRELSFDI